MAKTYVERILLKDYLIEKLSTNSIRTCIQDEDFKQKTGINTKYELEQLMKSFNINTKTIYEYCILNKLIAESINLTEFTNKRKNSSGFINNSKTSVEKIFNSKEKMDKKEEIINRILQAGFYADNSMSMEEIENLSKILL